MGGGEEGGSIEKHFPLYRTIPSFPPSTTHKATSTRCMLRPVMQTVELLLFVT